MKERKKRGQEEKGKKEKGRGGLERERGEGRRRENGKGKGRKVRERRKKRTKLETKKSICKWALLLHDFYLRCPIKMSKAQLRDQLYVWQLHGGKTTDIIAQHCHRTESLIGTNNVGT